MAWYESALARIHDERYGFTARAAAATALRLLPPPDESGLIVDLGAGSGIATQLLTDAGYSVLGVDVSPAMIEIARERAPGAHFCLTSVYATELPQCQAVLATGEIFNYATADRSNDSLLGLWARIANALVPGGFLLTDIAEPGRSFAGSPEHVTDTEAWTMWLRTTEDHEEQTLTRRMSCFVRDGEHYQRFDETHILELLSDAEVSTSLGLLGFTVDRLEGYDGFDLSPGWTVWLARKS